MSPDSWLCTSVTLLVFFSLFRSSILEKPGSSNIEDRANKPSEETLWGVIGSYMRNFPKYQGLIQKKCKTRRIYCSNSYNYPQSPMTLVFFSSEQWDPLSVGMS